MYIPINDTQNYTFCRLQLVVETFGQSTNNEPTDQNLINKLKIWRHNCGVVIFGKLQFILSFLSEKMAPSIFSILKS